MEKRSEKSEHFYYYRFAIRSNAGLCLTFNLFLCTWAYKYMCAHTHYKYYQSQRCCTSIHGMTNRVLKIQTKPLRRESIYWYLLVQCSGSRPRSMAAFSAGRPKASQPIGFRTCRKKQAHIRQNQANSDSSKFFCPLWLWSKAVSVLVLEVRICPQAEGS